MKKLTIIAIALLLSACSDAAYEVKFPAAPPEFADCKFARLENSKGANVTVARCPNSTTSTTYKSGKTTKTTIVVDGVEYVQE